MPPKKDTETKILDAALELFSKDGFKSATTRAIAEKAGVNEVTLFRHFESKKKLFLAVIDSEAMVRMDIIKMELEPSGNMVDDLVMVGSMISENMLRRADFFRLMVLEIDRYPEIWEHVGTIPLAAISRLSQYFDEAKERGLARNDVDSEVMAVTFFSYLFRILVANSLLGSDFFLKERDDAMRDFAQIFVNGVRSD